MKRTLHKVQLPLDFAQRLLDNQIQFKLAQTPSKQVISNLIELYTYGVEYYQAIKSHKYLYFQIKMKELFNAGTPLQIMNKKEQKQQSFQSPLQKKMKSQNQQEKIQAFKIKQKQQKMLNQIVQRTSYTATSSQTKNIIQNSQKQQLQLQTVITQQLQNQNRNLQQKLKLRKVRNLVAKSMSSIQLFQTPTRDSLFDADSTDKKSSISPQKSSIRKPLKVNFQSFINQNDENEQGEDDSNRKRKRTLFKSMRVDPNQTTPQMTQQQISAIIESVDFGNS